VGQEEDATIEAEEEEDEGTIQVNGMDIQHIYLNLWTTGDHIGDIL